MKCSVIIRNKNEERWIGHAIQSAVDFIDNPEIIIVDNNSTDNSRRVVSTFDYLDIKTHNIDNYTPGKSLNSGIELATNDNILILSAHCVMTECNLKKVDDSSGDLPKIKLNIDPWGSYSLIHK